jgi:hypothetical protein
MRVHHTIAIALASCAFAVPALADKPGSKGSSEQIRPAPGVAIVIQPRDRSAIQDYYRRNGPPGCPPGLAKKNNGCMPPGQVKKHYRNETLGPGIVIQGLPPRLLELLMPPPPGYGWGYVDGDVMLYALATRLIVDLVSSR